LVVKANVTVSEEDRLPEDEVIAQMSMLTFAATDTTSIALVKILEMLADHPKWQEKLRREVTEAFANLEGKNIPHDDIMRLPTLDAICRETLRLHSPATIMVRQATKDTALPLWKPLRGIDGSLVHEIAVPSGTTLHIDIHAINRDKAIWGEDAKEWNPERWLNKFAETVIDAKVPGVYSNVLTFSGGPYSCIGFKFSQLEMKIVLAVVLQSFKFSHSRQKDEITWNFANVMYPTVGREDRLKPSYPMNVELIKEVSV